MDTSFCYNPSTMECKLSMCNCECSPYITILKKIYSFYLTSSSKSMLVGHWTWNPTWIVGILWKLMTHYVNTCCCFLYSTSVLLEELSILDSMYMKLESIHLSSVFVLSHWRYWIDFQAVHFFTNEIWNEWFPVSLITIWIPKC